MELIGAQSEALVDWITTQWWQQGPPVGVIHGFPGEGKTQIGVEAVEALKRNRPGLTAVLFDCPDSKAGLLDDFLLVLAEELGAEGDQDLLEALEKGEASQGILARALARPRLIVVDEAQRLAIGATATLTPAAAALLERWSKTPNPSGRLLLLSSRQFGPDRWNERVVQHRLNPLKPAEAEQFLIAKLAERHLPDSVPPGRRTDVVTWLGCNPRAITLLVSALGGQTLDDLIGLAPEAWEARDRLVSQELLRDFERRVLTRAEDQLEAGTRTFLRRLSVLRRAVDQRGLEALSPEPAEAGRMRDELLSRFMLQFRRGLYEMHPVVRDTIRSQMTPADLRRAHVAAGRYHSAPFLAQRMVGSAQRLNGRFLEARYHFTMADSEADLAEISHRFETHFRATLGMTSRIPTDPEELDERITLLTALLQARGAKGLEYHLARCLVARGQPGDILRALPHARRSTGPQAPAAAWLLRIQIEQGAEGSESAIKAAREGFGVVPPAQNLFALYQAAGEILAKDGKAGEAVNLLRQGVKVVPTQNLFALYQSAAEILAEDGKAGEAVDLLRQGIRAVPPTQNLFALYQSAAEILAKDGKTGEAVDLLRQGIKVVPPTQSLSVLYQTGGIILNRTGQAEEALEWLQAGRQVLSDSQNGYRLAEQAIYVAYFQGMLDRIDLERIGPWQADLHAVISELARDRPFRAAALGEAAIQRYPRYFALYSATAFAWLCATQPDRAQQTLERFPGGLRIEPGSPTGWLRALVAIETGQVDAARDHLEAYLGRSLQASESADRALLLALWHASREVWGPSAAFYYPHLPAWLRSGESVPHSSSPAAGTGADDHAKPPGQAEQAPERPQAVAAGDFSGERVVRAMRPDGWFGLYILGCYDLVKTVYTQQARALTLIHALFRTGELKSGSRLGIIGGGAAGITAAAAAAVNGATVVLYEQASHLMPLQRQNTKRFLHPHIYDWPKPGADNPQAGLPILDWAAGLSGAVAKEILAGFEQIRHATGKITVHPGQPIRDITRVPSGDEQRRVRVLGGEGDINEIFDTVIVAIGFGLEPAIRLGIQTPRYWEDDDLDQALDASPDRPRRILVSGSGDGALIDIMRAKIDDFRHEEILAFIAEGDAFEAVKQRLLEVEDRARRSSAILGTSSVNLHQAYNQISIPDDLAQKLTSRIRTDTKVCFNFNAPERYSTGSSILNRFLVSTLCRLGAVEAKLARLEDGAVSFRPPEAYAVRWPGMAEPQLFDRAVIRHGPGADYLGSVFSEIGAASLALRTKIRELDLTGSLSQETIRFFA
ncbi:MAG TPA: AAA family ATPase [Acetobacteraceae bacterium]|nr:AAA family ATPase [Acetobacteraceae bacterium]